jgi:vacuolar-type H+-ATPase catalytic subunit A/Vma1
MSYASEWMEVIQEVRTLAEERMEEQPCEEVLEAFLVEKVHVFFL